MELVPRFQYKPMPPITYWIWMPLQEVNISIGKHIRSGSTMINTHWHAKIDAQQLFYFMILPVGRVLIDLAVSIKGTLQKYPRNFYIWQVRRMLSQEPWKYPSYRGGANGQNIKVQLLQLRWDVIKKNKNKWELSALVSSHSLNEETPVESQSNSPYLTSGGTHYNIVLCSKSCIRGTQCHQGALWWYRLWSACSCTTWTKLAQRLTFRWWTGRRILYIKFACKNLIVKYPQLLDMDYLTGSDIAYL